MKALLLTLWRTRLLSWAGLKHLAGAVWSVGISPAALVHWGAAMYGQRLAIDDGDEQLTYTQLQDRCVRMAQRLRVSRGLQPGQRVAIACQTHAAAIQALFACARLGVHVYLVSPDLPIPARQRLHERLHFAWWIVEESPAPGADGDFADGRWLPIRQLRDEAEGLPAGLSAGLSGPSPKPQRGVSGGDIVVLTGGTTGVPKLARRKPSLVDFLPPFTALVTQLQLDRHRSVFVATPVHHGFGLASLFLGILLGAELHFRRRFDAASVCGVIGHRQIQAVTVVPLMLHRLLDHDAGALRSLTCVICGGATLTPLLAQRALATLGPIVFNLYGTSEGGVAIMASPADLTRKPGSIGRPIRGVTARLTTESGVPVQPGEVGRLSLRSTWTIDRRAWIETGDLARRDGEGDLHLCGRVDEMIVSGGENVYPVELEGVLEQHPDVVEVAVVGIADAEFGERLKAVVVRAPQSAVTAADLRLWLKPRVARHQMPRTIEFVTELPTTPLGKVDKRALRMSATPGE